MMLACLLLAGPTESELRLRNHNPSRTDLFNPDDLLGKHVLLPCASHNSLQKQDISTHPTQRPVIKKNDTRSMIQGSAE